MRKTVVLKFLGIISMYSVYLVVGAHVIFADDLLFRSDPYNLAVYLGANALASSVLLLVFAVPMVLVSERCQSAVYRNSSLLMAGMICSTFCLLLIKTSGIQQQFLPGPIGLMVISAMCVSPILGAFFLSETYRKEIVKRVKILGKVTTIVIVILVPTAVMSNHVGILPAFSTRSDAGKHLLLIVVDGMPSQYLRTYNSEAIPTDFDDIFQNGHVFTNMRTSVPYTYGFFGVLYTGDRKHGVLRGKRTRRTPIGNTELASMRK